MTEIAMLTNFNHRQFLKLLFFCILRYSPMVNIMDHVYLRHLSTEYRSILSADMSTDMSTDSRSIYRPVLGRYVGRDSVDISADCRSTRMSGDTLRYFTATRPTLGRYFTDTRPALRSFGQLLLLSSIFSTQVLDSLF